MSYLPRSSSPALQLRYITGRSSFITDIWVIFTQPSWYLTPTIVVDALLANLSKILLFSYLQEDMHIIMVGERLCPVATTNNHPIWSCVIITKKYFHSYSTATTPSSSEIISTCTYTSGSLMYLSSFLSMRNLALHCSVHIYSLVSRNNYINYYTIWYIILLYTQSQQSDYYKKEDVMHVTIQVIYHELMNSKYY